MDKAPLTTGASMTAADADAKRTKMSWFMVGAAGATLICSFLPWATAVDEGLSGFSWGPGKVTAVVAILLGLYGYQGLRKDDQTVRYHGWAIAAVSIGIFTALISYSIVDQISQFSLGTADVGTGLLLTNLALLFAIWPLVVLRRDANARLAPAGAGAAPAAAAAAGPIAQTAAPEPAPATAHAAGWYDDPTARHERRYYDGSAWTEHVANGEAQAKDPID